MILGVLEFKTSKATVGNRKGKDLFSPKGACAGGRGRASRGTPGLPGGVAYLTLALTLSLSVALPRSRPIGVP